MPWELKRYQQARCLHFITFSCYRREPLLAAAVEIGSQWTARERERMGNPLRVVRRQEHPHPVAPNPGATRVGQPQK